MEYFIKYQLLVNSNYDSMAPPTDSHVRGHRKRRKESLNFLQTGFPTICEGIK